jgi:hypothetical protein
MLDHLALASAMVSAEQDCFGHTHQGRERERERARRTWAAWASADSALVGRVSAGSVWAGQVLAGRASASCDYGWLQGREREMREDYGGFGL